MSRFDPTTQRSPLDWYTNPKSGIKKEWMRALNDISPETTCVIDGDGTTYVRSLRDSKTSPFIFCIGGSTHKPAFIINHKLKL